MPKVAENTKQKKGSGVKVLKIIIAVILIIAIIAVAFVEIVTRKQADTNKDKVYIGGMLSSDTIEYETPSGDGIRHNPVIKLMQMIWYFCADGDAKKHANQTPPEVEMIKDVPYIDDMNLYHTLDVYYPEGTAPSDKLPVIIDIHGGGWMYGSKELNEYYCRALADRGFVVFNMSYRLVPDITVNEQLQDVMLALKWINENMSSYPCDSESIMLTGDSAGGMLSAYASVLMQSEELRNIFEVVNPEMNVDALLLTSPVASMNNGALSVYTKLLWGKDYKDKATYDYMNFDQIIDYASDFPPTYLITSSGDSLAHEQTLATAKLLESKSVQTVLKDYEKYDGKSLPHVFSVLEPFDEIGVETIDGAIDFYKDIISQKEEAK
ncbi:MAG: alpha/beta hydrolase [Eubacterium sp.]|nr:alpha/beta hydrolase [Eubacterium sp.]